MENVDLDALARAVLGRIFIELEASGRHVHVTKAQALQLFGHPLTPKRPLSQPGQYLANERVTVFGPKGEFANVAVLGPERPEAQVEVSLTDARLLGLTPPVRPSGKVENSPGVTLKGPMGTVVLKQGVIIAQRHIHVHPDDAPHLGVQDKQLVKLKTFTARPVIFEELLVRVHPEFRTSVHLDYDEANACGFKNGDLGRILQ